MRLLLVGDLHGDLHDADRAVYHAKSLDVDEIVQLGDWGFIWPNDDKLLLLEHILGDSDMQMRFIDGNHDDHPTLRSFEQGQNNLSPHITYQGRGTVHQYRDGTRVAFLGGAPSIDRKYRTTGRSWWPEEQITDEEVQRFRDVEPCHLLVTHDAPEPPPGIELTGDRCFDEDAANSLGAVSLALSYTRAKMLAHGHYHRRYSSVYNQTRIEGLAHGIFGLDDFCLLIDTKELM